jgi:hypothetical protein
MIVNMIGKRGESRMKDNNIRKVALIAILLLCLPLAAFAAPNTNADDDSYLAQYMTRYDYVLPQTIIEQIQVNFTPQEADCDLIRVRFDEILYDGQWMYTSASVWPQNPDEVIVMPGDVQKNDLVTGPYDEKLQNDMRSFESVAKEDGKQLLCVYAYMKEFDDIGEYFLDHFQKANGESVLMSGARMAGGCKAIKATWSIKVYDVDLETGKYSLLGEYLFPMKILPLQPYAERTYRVVSGEKDLFESVVLAYTPLNTYVFPQWKEKQDRPRFSIALVDANDTPFSQGVPLAADTYVLDTLPNEIFLIVSDYHTGEMLSRVALVADSCSLPTGRLDDE